MQMLEHNGAGSPHLPLALTLLFAFPLFLLLLLKNSFVKPCTQNLQSVHGRAALERLGP